MSCKTLVLILLYILDKIAHLFFLKMEAFRRESVNNQILLFYLSTIRRPLLSEDLPSLFPISSLLLSHATPFSYIFQLCFNIWSLDFLFLWSHTVVFIFNQLCQSFIIHSYQMIRPSLFSSTHHLSNSIHFCSRSDPLIRHSLSQGYTKNFSFYLPLGHHQLLPLLNI